MEKYIKNIQNMTRNLNANLANNLDGLTGCTNQCKADQQNLNLIKKYRLRTCCH